MDMAHSGLGVGKPGLLLMLCIVETVLPPPCALPVFILPMLTIPCKALYKILVFLLYLWVKCIHVVKDLKDQVSKNSAILPFQHRPRLDPLISQEYLCKSCQSLTLTGLFVFKATGMQCSYITSCCLWLIQKSQVTQTGLTRGSLHHKFLARLWTHAF